MRYDLPDRIPRRVCFIHAVCVPDVEKPATENILLAAHALGLGAVWTGCYPMEERMAQVSQVLDLPETIIPLCVIVMGYPNENPEPKDKWKPENVSYNKF